MRVVSFVTQNIPGNISVSPKSLSVSVSSSNSFRVEERIESGTGFEGSGLTSSVSSMASIDGLLPSKSRAFPMPESAPEEESEGADGGSGSSPVTLPPRVLRGFEGDSSWLMMSTPESDSSATIPESSMTTFSRSPSSSMATLRSSPCAGGFLLKK